MAPPDSRSQPRSPLLLQVQFPDEEGFLVDATENLSSGGAFVRTSRPFAIGDAVALVCSFPGLLAPMELNGVVAWVRAPTEGVPGGVGVRIPEENAEDRARLNALVAASQPAGKPAPRYRILFVEDNPHTVQMYEYAMKKLARWDRQPLEIAIAKDGVAALERLRAERFDLIVTDLEMPVLNGFEFIRRLRKVEGSAAVPVLVIGSGGAFAAEEASAAGANAFLRKPVQLSDVVETVRTLLKV